MNVHRRSKTPAPASGVQGEASDVNPLKNNPGNRTDSTLKLHAEPACHEAFQAQAAQRGDRLAVEDPGGSWNYAELNAQADCVARSLSLGGIRPGQIVAILAHRNRYLVAAILGVWKAGAAFVILDPAHPVGHLERVLALANPSGLIELEDSPRKLFDTVPLCCRMRLPLEREPEPAPLPSPDPDALAYAVFTSGTTGQPKGVAGTHRPVSHFIRWHIDTFGFQENDRFSLLSGLAHDPLLRDILTPLWAGGTLFIPSLEIIQDPLRLATWLGEQHITCMHLTPSMARFLEQAPKEIRLPALRHAFFCGEPLTREDVERFRRRAPEAECVNFYGSTETPQAMSFHRTIPGANGPLPVGRGIDGVELLVLAEPCKLAEPGEPGEIHIHSPYLSLGYIGDEAHTRERFITNPFTGDPKDRLFRTGDLGRVLPDSGEVEWLGRIDRQIKVRGLRVEPAEIEAILREHPSVAQAHVEWHSAEERLTAYIVPEHSQGSLPPNGELVVPPRRLITPLQRYLRTHLHPTMIPSALVFVKAFPLTPNGKIDTARLPPPEPQHDAEGTPTDALECQLQKVWEELLHLHPVGTHENFFDLGGHSLMAANLFARIGQITGRNLPLAALLQAPTIAQLAALIRGGGWENFWSALVPLQPRGTKPPLFLVHPVGGNVLGYRDLTEHLPADQPVFGLQALGLNGTEKPLPSVEAMASHYLREVRTMQPHGPYWLVGYSTGGIVAYEMAQQLASLGEPVPLLVLLDTEPSGAWQKPLPVRLVGHLQVLWEVPWPEKIGYVRGKLTLLFQNILSPALRTFRVPGNRDSAPAPLPRRDVLEEVRASNRRAVLNYRPKPYSGAVVLFRALQRQRFYEHFQREPDEGWRPLIRGGLTVIDIECDHGQILGKPNVAQIARRLQELLEKLEP